MIDTVRRRVAVTPPAVDGPVILGDDTSRVKTQESRFMIFMYTTNCSSLDEPYASHVFILFSYHHNSTSHSDLSECILID
jgi:hypothetical protein